MKRIIAVLSLVVLCGASEPDSTKTVKVTESSLSPYEKVLAGVLLINESYDMTKTKKHEYYLALLKEAGITHQQFQKSLKASKSSSKEWQKTMQRISSALE